MVIFIRFIHILGADKVKSLLTECLRSGTDYEMMAEVLETAANVELTGPQIERVAAVIANGRYKAALELYKGF
jgi:hypothetical protein